MKSKACWVGKLASLSVVLIVLGGSLTGCKLNEAASEGFFDAITDVVNTVVTDVLLPGD